MFALNSRLAKDSPVGVTSLLALATVASFCLLFRLSLHSVAGSLVRWGAAFFIVVAYLLFAPAVAGALYSLLFEPSKAFSLAALIFASVATVTVLILVDGLILLPFWFLGIMGVVKFVRWRASKNPASAPDLNR
jgi:hypothetical protein